MKIYKNVKLHYWTYSSILINSRSLSFKRVFLCLHFLHQNYTEGISSIPFLPFQSLFSAITHIHQSLQTCTPQTLSSCIRTCSNFFTKQGTRSRVILLIHTLPPCLCEPTRNMAPSQWMLILPYHLSFLH